MRLNRLLLASLALASISTIAAAQNYRDRGPDRPGNNTYYDRQCDNRPPPQQADCARQALAVSDRALNDQYQRLLRAAQDADRPDPRRRPPRRQPGWYSQEAALRDAQRAWITMRDADCKFVTQPDIDRRMASLTYTMCLVDRSEERTTALRQMEDQMADRRGPPGPGEPGRR